jgi:hypothetical protein
MLTTQRSRTWWRERVSPLLAAFVFALLLGVAFPAQGARAEGGSAQFSLRPVASDPTAAYFVFNLQQSATIQSQVRVTNTGTARGSVALYPVDATTGQTSGVVYLSRGEPRTDVGAWVTVGTQQLTLDPGQSQTVAFTLTVPPSVRPGQHVGGLVGENLAIQEGSPSNGGVQINIQHLSIVAVQVNLPGQQAQRLEATRIQAGGEHGYQTLLLSLRNAGTQMLKPSGTLQVTDTTGRQLKRMTLTLDTFLPQTAIDYPVYVDGQALGPGHYKGALSLTYGDPQQPLNRTFDFQITSSDVQQVFGSKPPNTPPGIGREAGGLLVVMGSLALLLLTGLGASLLFVPGLRARAPFRKR